MENPSEYELVNHAILRIELEPTSCQYYMALIPSLYLLLTNLSIICLLEYFKEINESLAPIVIMVLSVLAMVVEIVTIAFRHHVRYNIIRHNMECILPVNIIQIIASGIFMMVIKNRGKYTIYMIWTGIPSILMFIVILIPFGTDLFIHNREM